MESEFLFGRVKGSRQTVGFLGDKFIEIKRPGNVESGISDAGFIPQASDASDLQEVISLIGSIAEDVKKVTANLSAVLGDKQGQDSISNIVENIDNSLTTLEVFWKIIEKM